MEPIPKPIPYAVEQTNAFRTWKRSAHGSELPAKAMFSFIGQSETDISCEFESGGDTYAIEIVRIPPEGVMSDFRKDAPGMFWRASVHLVGGDAGDLIRAYVEEPEGASMRECRNAAYDLLASYMAPYLRHSGRETA
jgi:hypothetical protein